MHSTTRLNKHLNAEKNNQRQIPSYPSILMSTLLFSSFHLNAAEINDLRPTHSGSYQNQLSLSSVNFATSPNELKSSLGLSHKYQLKLIRQTVDQLGILHKRYQQRDKGIPILKCDINCKL